MSHDELGNKIDVEVAIFGVAKSSEKLKTCGVEAVNCGSIKE